MADMIAKAAGTLFGVVSVAAVVGLLDGRAGAETEETDVSASVSGVTVDTGGERREERDVVEGVKEQTSVRNALGGIRGASFEDVSPKPSPGERDDDPDTAVTFTGTGFAGSVSADDPATQDTVSASDVEVEDTTSDPHKAAVERSGGTIGF